MTVMTTPLTYEDGWTDLWEDKSFRGEHDACFHGITDDCQYAKGWREAGILMDHIAEVHNGKECDC